MQFLIYSVFKCRADPGSARPGLKGICAFINQYNFYLPCLALFSWRLIKLSVQKPNLICLQQKMTVYCHFLYPPHDSGRVLWFHVGCPCVCPSVVHPSVPPFIFSFPDDNSSKYEWFWVDWAVKPQYKQTITKLSMFIDIVEIWFGIANWQLSSIFDRVICPRPISIFVSR